MHFRFKPRRNPGSQSQHRSVNRTAVAMRKSYLEQNCTNYCRSNPTVSRRTRFSKIPLYICGQALRNPSYPALAAGHQCLAASCKEASGLTGNPAIAGSPAGCADVAQARRRGGTRHAVQGTDSSRPASEGRARRSSPPCARPAATVCGWEPVELTCLCFVPWTFCGSGFPVPRAFRGFSPRARHTRPTPCSPPWPLLRIARHRWRTAAG